MAFFHFYVRTVGACWLNNRSWSTPASVIKSTNRGFPPPPDSSPQPPQPRPTRRVSRRRPQPRALYGSRVAAGRGAGRPALDGSGGRQAGRQTGSQAGGGGRAGCRGRERVSHCARVREGRSEGASSPRPPPSRSSRQPTPTPRHRLPSAQRPGRAEPSRVGPGPCCSPCTVCGGTSPR